MFSNMKPAEKRLLEACQKGEVLNLADERPRKKTDNNEIRGKFLRALILSNNQEIEVDKEKFILKIDPNGIIFIGAYISGNFDFSFCNTDLPFLFKNSVFENEISFCYSKIKFLDLSKSKITSFFAQGLICQSDIFLAYGFESNGKVDLNSTQISGSLICVNGKFNNKNGNALNCSNAKIGAVFLKNGFESNGNVTFALSQIERDLDCDNGKFNNKNGYSLDCDGAKINGAVFLTNGFESNGEVNLNSLQIGHNLECYNGKIHNKYANALSCDKIKISGSVSLRDGFETQGKINFGSCFISKSFIFSNSNEISFLTLNSAQISRLDLDISNVENIDLDGCIYEHLDSIKFSQWSNKMPKEDNFKPQPYKQLAKVLRNMGHNEDANSIMIKYNDELRKKDFLTCDRLFIFILKWIYGKTAGYGYKPMRVLGTMFMVWFLCSLFYWNASKVAVFAPTNPLVFQKKDSYICNVNSNGTPLLDFFNYSKYNSSNNWILNENLEGEYTTFNPFLYSLDVILPIVDLEVEKDWGQYVSPNDWTLNDITRWLMWFEILFGWTYSLILVAILSGLAKNEKD
ncbi:hypothetical protein [Aliarcobacter butzleri]|uniref:hypothetical protein n=1 Tax=Aliarcobacter butzleri TaxID=28197 RepID=UPI002B2497CA|nr:hypothetical protein [Aliarcobacter butzleri]